MNNLIYLLHNQKSIYKGGIKDIQEGSLSLLDVSSSRLEALPQMKESILTFNDLFIEVIIKMISCLFYFKEEN